jgi:hypothetical protein
MCAASAESNGDLATLIAKRNFNRTKTNSYANKKGAQKSLFFLAKATNQVLIFLI